MTLDPLDPSHPLITQIRKQLNDNIQQTTMKEKAHIFIINCIENYKHISPDCYYMALSRGWPWVHATSHYCSE